MSAKEKQATRSGICFSCAINEKAFDEVKQRVRQHGLSNLTQCKKNKRRAESEITMAIIINLDVMMAMRKKGLTELAGEIDITLANLSILKNNKAKAIRLSTLNEICKALDCQPGDLLQYVADEENTGENGTAET